MKTTKTKAPLARILESKRIDQQKYWTRKESANKKTRSI